MKIALKGTFDEYRYSEPVQVARRAVFPSGSGNGAGLVHVYVNWLSVASVHPAMETFLNMQVSMVAHCSRLRSTSGVNLSAAVPAVIQSL
ncbi:MAG: hypothetical protein LBU32_22165 [Clostridiales bacterium]|nr:hypothetical protein [Clostridiales bacterium]